MRKWATNEWVASLLSVAICSGTGILAINYLGAQRGPTIVTAVVATIVMSWILMTSDDEG